MSEEHQNRHHLDHLLFDISRELGSNDPKERKKAFARLHKIQRSMAKTAIGGQVYAERVLYGIRDAKTGLQPWHTYKETVVSFLENPEFGDAVIMSYDLVGFGVINKAKGHEFGDQFLSEFGNLLNSVIRQPDAFGNVDINAQFINPEYAYRTGGDEFASLLTGIVDTGNIDLTQLTRDKIHLILKNPDLKLLLKENDIPQFGVRAGAAVLDRSITYKDNMDMADPKNEENGNKYLRVESIIVAKAEDFEIIDRIVKYPETED